MNNGKVIGDEYWDPIMIAAAGVGWELGAHNVVSNALPALKKISITINKR